MKASQGSIERVFYIDLNEISTRDGFQQRIAAELPVPGHYGMNLDALYDILTENGAGWNLIFYGSSALRSREPKYFATVLRLCDEACAGTPGLRIRFFG